MNKNAFHKIAFRLLSRSNSRLLRSICDLTAQAIQAPSPCFIQQVILALHPFIIFRAVLCMHTCIAML